MIIEIFPSKRVEGDKKTESKLPILGHPLLDGRQQAPV